MRTMLYPSFNREFITVSGESRPGLPPTAAARDLFARFNTELHAHGFSLDDTLRTRLWGRNRAARDGGSRERVQILSDQARSAWANVVKLSCFLHRSQTMQYLRTGILMVLGAERGTLLGGEAPAAVKYSFVDGYSTPGKLIEIETTAVF